MNASKKAEKQFFTVEEANQRLPLVRVIVDDIVRLFRDVHDRRERLAQIRQLPGASNRNEDTVYSEELDQTELEIQKDIERLEGFIAELHELGIELKDPVVGLIDFPTMIDGREAYLCWKLGEGDISFWHELNEGLQGRQSLLESSLSGELPAGDEQTD